MCLAIPGRVVEIHGESAFERQAQVAFSGVTKTVSLALLPEAVCQDYVLVHAGVAISVLQPERARQTLRELGQPEPEQKPNSETAP